MPGPAPLSLERIEAAYRLHAHHVLRRATRLLGDVREAEEVVHDVFVSLLDRPEQFAGRSSLATWLYSATTHRCLNRLRDARTRRRLEAEGLVALAHPAAPAPADDVARLRRLLVGLPEALAQVAVYFYADQMSHRELAAMLGCSRRRTAELLDRLQRIVASEKGIEDASP